MIDPKRPYLAKLTALARKAMSQPGVTHVTVRHEPMCAALWGKAECNCDPDVTLGKPDDA